MLKSQSRLNRRCRIRGDTRNPLCTISNVSTLVSSLNVLREAKSSTFYLNRPRGGERRAGVRCACQDGVKLLKTVMYLRACAIQPTVHNETERYCHTLNTAYIRTNSYWCLPHRFFLLKTCQPISDDYSTRRQVLKTPIIRDQLGLCLNVHSLYTTLYNCHLASTSYHHTHTHYIIPEVFRRGAERAHSDGCLHKPMDPTKTGYAQRRSLHLTNHQRTVARGAFERIS